MLRGNCVPGIVLGTRGSSVHKTDTDPYSSGASILAGGNRQSMINSKQYQELESDECMGENDKVEPVQEMSCSSKGFPGRTH